MSTAIIKKGKLVTSSFVNAIIQISIDVILMKVIETFLKYNLRKMLKQQWSWSLIFSSRYHDDSWKGIKIVQLPVSIDPKAW